MTKIWMIKNLQLFELKDWNKMVRIVHQVDLHNSTIHVFDLPACCICKRCTVLFIVIYYLSQLGASTLLTKWFKNTLTFCIGSDQTFVAIKVRPSIRLTCLLYLLFNGGKISSSSEIWVINNPKYVCSF